jgi:hypothetical protein
MASWSFRAGRNVGWERCLVPHFRYGKGDLQLFNLGITPKRLVDLFSAWGSLPVSLILIRDLQSIKKRRQKCHKKPKESGRELRKEWG